MPGPNITPVGSNSTVIRAFRYRRDQVAEALGLTVGPNTTVRVSADDGEVVVVLRTDTYVKGKSVGG